jgi:hypothetical protein
MSELLRAPNESRRSKFRWRLGRILSSGLLLVLLGFTPIGVAAMMLGQTLRGVVPVQGGVLTELAFATLVGAFGSMVVLLCLLPLRTWRIEGTTIIVGWLGMFATPIEATNIRSFGKLLVSGSAKHGIRPYSILCFERNDGRRYDFSSPLFTNNNELEQFLAAQGITQIEGLSSSLHLRIWVIHILIMVPCVIVVLLTR